MMKLFAKIVHCMVIIMFVTKTIGHGHSLVSSEVSVGYANC